LFKTNGSHWGNVLVGLTRSDGSEVDLEISILIAVAAGAIRPLCTAPRPPKGGSISLESRRQCGSRRVFPEPLPQRRRGPFRGMAAPARLARISYHAGIGLLKGWAGELRQG
jgi:hypothetical protein